MRCKNNYLLLKLTAVVFVFVFLIYLWTTSVHKRQSYFDKFTNKVKLARFLEKLNETKLQVRQNGNFWILENYIIAKKEYEYLDTLTYTTHGEYMFLHNLEEVVKRWRAPISVAIFAPSTDFNKTLISIDYLRSCIKGKYLIRDWVTFHIYFPATHMPSFIPKFNEVNNKLTSINCSELSPYGGAESKVSYRRSKSILYPINVGRNIARRLAKTHYIFPCDIEMYPNWDFVEAFMDMIRRRPHLLMSTKIVFPLAVFEVEENQEIPNTKTDLQDMLMTGKAIPFHLHVCMQCHAIPQYNKWIKQKETAQLDIFLTAKHHANWEPFYVTTNSEPFYDERFSWEGRYDKQIQAYLLSIMNYDFCILNNAFLVHRPGIKMHSDSSPEILKTKLTVQSEIIPQLKILYGQ